jgi:hypothetical protein
MLDRLKELFECVGRDLVWRVHENPEYVRKRAGSFAGMPHLKNRHIRVGFDGMYMYAHHIVWLLHGNEIPISLEIDHIDRDCTNNHIKNLRLVTSTQNKLNRSDRTEDTGVYFNKERKKWVAQISKKNKNWNLGRFNTKEEAKAAYAKAYKELHGDFK